MCGGDGCGGASSMQHASLLAALGGFLDVWRDSLCCVTATVDWEGYVRTMFPYPRQLPVTSQLAADNELFVAWVSHCACARYVLKVHVGTGAVLLDKAEL